MKQTTDFADTTDVFPDGYFAIQSVKIRVIRGVFEAQLIKRRNGYPFSAMSIAENLLRVRERIARAAESAGRTADEITLVGVTKYVGPREAGELFTAGCHDLGESRPQELWSKSDDLQRAALEKGDATAL